MICWNRTCHVGRLRWSGTQCQVPGVVESRPILFWPEEYESEKMLGSSGVEVEGNGCLGMRKRVRLIRIDRGLII